PLPRAQTAQMTTTSDGTGLSSSISVITSADGGSIVQGAALTISCQTSNAPAGSVVALLPRRPRWGPAVAEDAAVHEFGPGIKQTCRSVNRMFRGRKSKSPGEIALDRMVVRTVGELARIGDADLGLRGELQIAARFDQRGVARNRNTQD